MTNDQGQQWFFQELTRSAFFIYSVTWVLLLVMETLKPGIVSNYLSLTHAVIPLMVLGILWVVLLPSEVLPEVQEKRPFPLLLLSLISLGLILVLFLLIQASFALTVIIIFATLAALWGGVYSFWNQSN